MTLKLVLVFLTAFLCIRNAPAADTNTVSGPAKVGISGYGLFGNRQLKRLVVSLNQGGKQPSYFTPAFIEDATMILKARMRRDGYLKPTIFLKLSLASGSTINTDAQSLLDNPLPHTLQIKRADFRIRKGVLYHFTELRFENLTAVPRRKAHSFFYKMDALVKTKRTRVFTPDRLRQGMSSLEDVLDRLGYRDATARPSLIRTNDSTGAVRVTIKVNQGARYRVHSLKTEIVRAAPGETNPPPDVVRFSFPNQPYSTRWVEDTSLRLQTNEFTLGHPDVSVQIEELQKRPGTNWVDMDLAAHVYSEPQVRVGTIHFDGQKRTSAKLLARRVRVEPGDLLDPLRIERGRHRLAQLGIFQRVTATIEATNAPVRDVFYKVQESKTLNVNLLAGYGSYEQLRGGAELEFFNIWGLAHNARIKGVQSFKSTSGEGVYNIPQILGRDFDLFLNGNFLRREEVSFTREEFGGGIGVHRYFQPISSDVSLRYNFQVLNAANIFPAVSSEGLTNPAVGSIILDFRHDRRNNPLYPRSGYKIFGYFETASSSLGGDANYHRLELTPSVHFDLGGGTYVSAGLSHGVVVSFGAVSQNLPFNRRFFPGGENSIRGYPEGEASPRNAQGEFVGAETYTLGTVELEQALTTAWSLVFFSDSLGYARRLDAYPWDDALFSVGGGIRWKTVVGPVRAEYGYNLNPRKDDPTGTFQISIGFPF